MGYLPPGDDVRRLHQLESRFTPVVRRLVGAYPGTAVPLAACQEAVARWFGHPNWHAQVQRHRRSPSEGPDPGLPDTPVGASPVEPDASWLVTVPEKTLKSLANALQKQLNLYRDHDRGPLERWTGARPLATMATAMGFRTALDLNQAWAARGPSIKPRPGWWSRTIALLRPTPPQSPMVWARTQQDLPTALSVVPPDERYRPAEPLARAIGQDLDSGWWMGLTDDQVRTHTFLLGEQGSGRDTVLLGWVTEAMRQGQGAVWLCGHTGERAVEVERRWDEQARLCWRDQDRWTLDLVGLPTPVSRRRTAVTVNLLEELSAGALTEMLFGALTHDETGEQMWQGRRIGLLSAVCMALVWERTEQHRPFTLDRLEASLHLDALRTMASVDRGASHVSTALRTYLRNLPGYTEGTTELAAHVHETHDWLARPLFALVATLRQVEPVLFNATDPARRSFLDLMAAPGLLLIQCGDLARTAPAITGAVMQAMKSGLAHTLGLALDGHDAEVVELRPTNARQKGLWIFDNLPPSHHGGMAAIPSQARGLGIGMVSAMDTLALMAERSSSPDGMTNTLINVNTRVLMRQACVDDLLRWWDTWVPGERLAFPIPGQGEAPALVSTPMPRPRPDVLLHYAIGEALVIHKDEWWHTGLAHNLLSPI